MKKFYALLFLFAFLTGFKNFAQLSAPTSRVYASSQTNDNWGLGGGTFTNPANAVDQSDSTASTLTLIASLGAGGVDQTLSFATAVPANTPVHVKVGASSSAANLGGYTIVEGFDASGNSVATASQVDIVGLLGGENTYESILTSATPIKTVRIRVGATLGLGVVAKVYAAYYEVAASSGDGSIAFDVLEGTETTGLINAASITSGVTNPYNAIDGDTTSYASLYAAANVAAQQQVTALFPGLYAPGTYAHVLFEVPNQLLSLSLISNQMSVELLYNDSVVQTISGTSGWGLVDLQLLGLGSTAKGWLNIPATASFNAVKVISNSSLASVFPTVNVYEITRDDIDTASLPVTYAQQLKAVVSDGKVLLTWATGVESDNNYFDIERSSDGKVWTSIGKVTTKVPGGTGNGTDYSFTDASPLNGINYYKLIQTDLDGHTASGIIVKATVTAAGTNTSFKIYPSPAVSQVTLNADVTVVKVFDASGKTVIIDNKSTVNVSKLSKGIYFITATTKDGKTVKGKFIKE